MQSHTAAAPARPNEVAGPAGREAQRRPYYGLRVSVSPWLLLLIAGCGQVMQRAIDAKTEFNARTSGVGLKLHPFGESLNSPKLGLGFFQTQISLVPTDPATRLNAPPLINRTEIRGPFGVRVTDGTYGGAVGQEFAAGGETLARSIEAINAQPAQQPAAAP